ncbi:MAG: IclR family transcriptional regulator [Desulfobacterales bacterium]|nr:IclR family transcriptional regulator [Desulfobacterales bacterium]
MKQKKKKPTEYRVQALNRALDILDSFTFQEREMNLSQIVQKTELNKTTAKRLMSNLTLRGYLQQDPSSKHYQLGLRVFELGGIVFSSFSLRNAAIHPMTRLQNETGATVLLGIKMEDQLVYIDKREGRGMLRISSDIGWRRPLHYGMLGMVLMAYLDSKKISEILKKSPLKAYTSLSITDKDAFGARLEEIRKQRYVFEKEEVVEGGFGVAAPIRDYSREVIAALGISLPVSQSHPEGALDQYAALVMKAGDEISSQMGYMKI